MAKQEYRRPQAETFVAPVTGELEIKRSRFLTFIGRVTDEVEAREFIAQVKRQYPDARHHCSAFIFEVPDANPVERSSDDGEPAGTAGSPMLEVLRGSGLSDICAVVVRYFGGIKLGTGGLVRAYTDAVATTLPQVPAVTRKKLELWQVKLQHGEAGKIEAELRAAGYPIIDVAYESQVKLSVAVEPGTAEQLHTFLAAVTHGGPEARRSGTNWVEVS